MGISSLRETTSGSTETYINEYTRESCKIVRGLQQQRDDGSIMYGTDVYVCSLCVFVSQISPTQRWEKHMHLFLRLQI